MVKESHDYISVKKFPIRFAQAVLLIASLVFVGWIFNISLLKRIAPDFVVMNPTTALLFMLCGSALWLHQLNGVYQTRRIVDLLSGMVILIALVRIIGFLPSLDTGVDQLFFRNQLNGNRMAPNTTLNFFLSGLSLFFLNRDKKAAYFISQLLTLATFVIALLAVIGYLYVDRTLYRVASYIPMAIHTAVTFLMLTLGFLFAGSRYALMSVIARKNIGGRIARILLPITLLIPILFGWLRLVGQHRGLFNLEFGTALLTISIIVVFTVLIWGLAWSINGTDEKRKKAENDMIIAKLEAEEAKKTQELFLANMSHEIRTPINGVMGMVQLVATTELTEEQKEYMGMITESASNLLVIINDILDLTKIKVGKISLESVRYSVRHSVKSLIKLFGFKASQTDIKLNCSIAPEIPEFLMGDPVRLNQVLTNLVNNAIKFTPKGEVNVIVNLLEEDDTSVTLSFVVQDTGIGIAEDKIEGIFESFTQASTDTTRKFGGTGLGLTISKQLIELQGGNITVSSKPNEGSSFIFSLSFKKVAENHIAETSHEGVPSGMDQLKILLAEDNLINQKVASKLLSKQGAEVDIANNGTEVLTMLTQKPYDIILMDINMPEMDGFEATKNIRQTESYFQSIPIIALTASAFESEKDKCMKLGMNDYMSKPFKAEELFAKIREHLS
ncbi:MAG: response regulator [Sediminibacterium sp.]